MFNSKWTNNYLFTVVNSKVLCLVCQTCFQFQKNIIFDAILKPNIRISLNQMLMKRGLKHKVQVPICTPNKNYFKPSSNESATAIRATVATATTIQQMFQHASKEETVVLTFPRSQDVSPLRRYLQQRKHTSRNKQDCVVTALVVLYCSKLCRPVPKVFRVRTYL